jgi:hypothetical protein
LKWIPNYFWNDGLGSWIIAVHDKAAKDDILPNQVLLYPDDKLGFFLKNNINARSKVKELEANMKRSLQKSDFSIHVSSKYPENFLPRAFYLKSNLILTGRTIGELEELKKKIENSVGSLELRSARIQTGDFIQKFKINFQWDFRVYADYCSKIAFELLSLFIGRDSCLDDKFDGLRNRVISYLELNPTDVVYTQEKQSMLFDSRLVPNGWMSYIEVPKGFFIIPLIDDEHQFDHCIFIYELPDGLVCATVQLFNLKPMQIVLGKRSESFPHLETFKTNSFQLNW